MDWSSFGAGVAWTMLGLLILTMVVVMVNAWVTSVATKHVNDRIRFHEKWDHHNAGMV